MNKAEDHERVSLYQLDPEDRDRLLLEQKECVFNWCTKDEWPITFFCGSAPQERESMLFDVLSPKNK